MNTKTETLPEITLTTIESAAKIYSDRRASVADQVTELNAAIEDEWPAPVPHWHQFRTWMRRRNQPAADNAVTAGAPAETPEAAVIPS